MNKEQIMHDNVKRLRDQYHKLFKASLNKSSEYYHSMGIVAGLDIALQTLKLKK